MAKKSYLKRWGHERTHTAQNSARRKQRRINSDWQQSDFAEWHRRNNRDIIAGVVMLVPALTCACVAVMWITVK